MSARVRNTRVQVLDYSIRRVLATTYYYATYLFALSYADHVVSAAKFYYCFVYNGQCL